MACELRVLETDELASIISMSRERWHPNVSLELFTRSYVHLLQTPWASSHVQILGWFQDGRLVSSCRRHHLEMLINGRKYNCVGVGELLTLPEDRHKEHSSAMLRAALDSFASHYAVCLLFSESGAKLYRKLGFFPLPNLKYILLRSRQTHLGPSSGNGNGAVRARRQLTMQGAERLQAEARAFVESDLPDVVQIYNLDVSLRRIGVLRTEAYWQHLFEKERVQQALVGDESGELRTYVCKVEERTASYMAVRVLRDRIQVLESPAESFRFQNWMLRYALQLSHNESISRVESQLPIKGEEEEARIMVRREMPLMMLHPMSCGLRSEDFPYPAENFLWSRDRF